MLYLPGTILCVLYLLCPSQGLFALYTLEIWGSKKSNDLSKVIHQVDSEDSNVDSLTQTPALKNISFPR